MDKPKYIIVDISSPSSKAIASVFEVEDKIFILQQDRGFEMTLASDISIYEPLGTEPISSIKIFDIIMSLLPKKEEYVGE